MNKVLDLSKRITVWLAPYCKKIQIVGSIRRGEKNPKDIDIVLIPKNRGKLENFLIKKGKKLQGGDKESTWKIEKVRVELYYTTPEEWGAELLAYSSKKGSGIGLRVVAKKLRFKLTQHGLFRGMKRIAGKTEREIYKTLKRPYKEPWKR